MKFSKPLLLIISTLFFIGCSNTPEEAVNGMYDGLKKGNLSTLLQNTTEPTSGAFSAKALRECSVDKKSYTDDLKLVEDCLTEMYSNIEIKSLKLIKEEKDTASVEVNIKNGSIENNTTINLIKVDGRWKVTLSN
jgi:hypothetical protein